MENLAEKMDDIWKKNKKQPKDIWFFYLFLLTFTLGVRKVILYFLLKGAFNEYIGAYIYVSDIFLWLAILSWIIPILCNKIVNPSRISDGTFKFIHKIDHAEGVNNASIQNLSTGKIAYFKAFLTKLFHVEQSKRNVGEKCSTWNIFCNFGVFLVPLLLVIWSFVSIFWSENRAIGIYRSIGFLELYFLYSYIAIRFVPCYLLNCSTWNNFLYSSSNVSRGTILDEAMDSSTKLFHVEHFEYVLSKMTQYLRAILLGLIVVMLFDHYLWDIWQGQILFWLACGLLAGISLRERHNVSNCSTWNNLRIENASNVSRGTINNLGVFFGIIMLLGIMQSLAGIVQFIIQHSLGLFLLKESLIGQSIPGVAKIVANHHVFIRSYGLFPHPNILGGFLFFSIMATMLYSKLFHVEQDAEKCSTWNNLSNNDLSVENVPRGTIKSNFIKFVLAVQIIGIILSFSKSAILALLVALVYINVPRGTFRGISLKKLFHVEHFRLLLGLGLATLTGLFFFRVEFYVLLVKSLTERGLYLSISERIIADNPMVGVGTGQFVITAERLLPNLEIWQYQPVHNIFLLIWSEWGIVGLVLFVVFLWKLFHVE